MIFACIRAPPTYVQLDILFCQITTFINVRVVIVFWASDPLINGFY